MHTNVMQIIKEFIKDERTKLDIFIKFSKSNYIYTLYSDTFSIIIKELYDNFDNGNREKFTLIIESVLENKVCAEYYLPIMIQRIENLRKVQYIQIFDQLYEILAISFIVTEIDNLIKNKCEEFDIRIKDYV